MGGYVRISNESVQQAGDVSCQQTLRKRGIIYRISDVSKYKGRDNKKVKNWKLTPTPKLMLARSSF